MQPNLRAHTVRDYESIIRCHLIPAIGAIPLQQLSPLHVKQMLQGLQRKPRRKTGDSLLGTPLTPSNPDRTFSRLCEEANVRRIRFHDLRHSAATLGIRAGIPLKVISERLGHSTIALTADTYSHVSADMQMEAARKIAQELGQ
ncbi:MAG: tyrosine-type recombinase/integrase family protein [Firmicutes bacterium]|nr:tyrosine-type recombinase/integrase family protein [Bacillota bacterium]